MDWEELKKAFTEEELKKLEKVQHDLIAKRAPVDEEAEEREAQRERRFMESLERSKFTMTEVELAIIVIFFVILTICAMCLFSPYGFN
jgi:hypothetical protein